MTELPLVPERAGVRTGDPFNWPLTHEEAEALLAEVEAEGWRLGRASPLAIREDGPLWQKDGYSPCRFGWAFTLLIPHRERWMPVHIYSVAFRYFWAPPPVMRVLRHGGEADARRYARQWLRSRR